VSGLAAGLAFALGGDDNVVVTADEAQAAAVPRVRNIYVDPETGQFILSPTGNLALVADNEAISQAIKQAVATYLGEWFLDETIGVAWVQSILVKNPNLAVVKEVIREAIAGVQGVASVDQLNVVFDKVSRGLAYTFAATSDLGLLVSRTFQVGTS
jgi:hypothetical protein